jgi:FixJ family two-component response regulator
MTLAYLVDDDEAIRDAIAWLLRSRGVQSRAFRLI